MANFSELVVKLELQQAAFAKGMDQAARQLERAKKSADDAGKGMESFEKSFGKVASAAGKLAAAFAAFKSLEAIAKASDQLDQLAGSFVALTGSASRGRDMMERTFAVVGNTGVSLDSAANSLQRLTIAMVPLGASNNQIQTLAENFAKLGRIGGSSMEDTANGLRQLGQALASGSLSGDELKSIRENVPLVAKAIADGLGVPTGALKELGEQGRLTSDVVANSLLKVTEEVNRQFALLPRTLEQATNQMEAQATRTAATFNELTGIGRVFVESIDHATEILQRWGNELKANEGHFNALQSIARVVQLAFEALVVITAEVAFWVEQIIKLIVTLGHVAALLTIGEWSSAAEVWNANADAIKRARLELDAFAAAVVNGRQASPFAAAGAVQARGAAKPGEPTLITPPGKAGAGGKDADREAEALKKRGEALTAAVDAQEAYNQKLREYDELLGKGAITQATFEKATEAAKEQLTAAGDALTASVDPAFAYELAMRKINKAYADGSIEVETWLKLQEKAKEEMDKLKDKDKEDPFANLKEGAQTAVEGGIKGFFDDLINGSMTAAQAFSKMVKSIVSDLAKLLAEFAAKQAAKFIISSIFGSAAGGKAGPQSVGGGAPALTLATFPSWSPAASLAATPFGSTRAIGGDGATQTGGVVQSGGPWNVVINNNAPGVDVSANQRNDGALEVTVQRVRALLSQDIMRGGNAFARSLETAYGLGRGR